MNSLVISHHSQTNSWNSCAIFLNFQSSSQNSLAFRMHRHVLRIQDTFSKLSGNFSECLCKFTKFQNSHIKSQKSSEVFGDFAEFQDKSSEIPTNSQSSLVISQNFQINLQNCFVILQQNCETDPKNHCDFSEFSD